LRQWAVSLDVGPPCRSNDGHPKLAIDDNFNVYLGTSVFHGHPAEPSDTHCDILVAKYAQTAGSDFLRGDSDTNGVLNLTDAVFTLTHLFRGGSASDCPDAADTDDDGSLTITDAVLALSYLFLGVTTIPAPGAEECGSDPTEDTLGPCTYSSENCASTLPLPVGRNP
jgi:hypothetical protein